MDGRNRRRMDREEGIMEKEGKEWKKGGKEWKEGTEEGREEDKGSEGIMERGRKEEWNEEERWQLCREQFLVVNILKIGQ